MPSAGYTKAYGDVSKMGEKLKASGGSGPSQTDQLQLYGLAKVAEGKDFSAAEKPGMFNVAGKAKYNEWKKHVDAGLSQKDAEAQYVTKAKELLTKYDK